MKYEEVAGLSATELNKKSKDLRQQLFTARMKNALGQMTNPMEIRGLRRDIARLKTAATANAGKKASSTKSRTKG
jgi:large subunit ribosomal protein L29